MKISDHCKEFLIGYKENNIEIKEQIIINELKLCGEENANEGG